MPNKCDLKYNKDGSVDFESLIKLPPECQIPEDLKSIKIPLENAQTKLKSVKSSKNSVKTQNTISDTILVPEEAMETKEVQASAQLPATPSITENTVATVGVDQAINQVKSLVPAGADASPALMIGGAAALAVVGAAIKFGPSMLKARAEKAEREHEAKMKQLEIEEKKAEKQEDSHQQCNVSRMALEAKVASLTSTLETINAKHVDLEKQLSSVKEEKADFGDLSPDELIERIEKLEKKLKPAKPAKSKK